MEGEFGQIEILQPGERREESGRQRFDLGLRPRWRLRQLELVSGLHRDVRHARSRTPTQVEEAEDEREKLLSDR